jgi:DNA-binding response OmpR family regulator
MPDAMTTPLAVLIIEDEPLITMMIEDFIDILGHKVAGTADSVAGALTLVEAGGFDVVILDVHLSDGACWPVADALTAHATPFLIATGGHVEPPPDRHAAVRQLSKPFTIDGIKAALEAITGG